MFYTYTHYVATHNKIAGSLFTLQIRTQRVLEVNGIARAREHVQRSHASAAIGFVDNGLELVFVEVVEVLLREEVALQCRFFVHHVPVPRHETLESLVGLGLHELRREGERERESNNDNNTYTERDLRER